MRRRYKTFLRERNQFSASGTETLLSVSEYYGVKPRPEAFVGEEHESRAASLEGYNDRPQRRSGYELHVSVEGGIRCV